VSGLIFRYFKAIKFFLNVYKIMLGTIRMFENVIKYLSRYVFLYQFINIKGYRYNLFLHISVWTLEVQMLTKFDIKSKNNDFTYYFVDFKNIIQG